MNSPFVPNAIVLWLCAIAHVPGGVRAAESGQPEPSPSHAIPTTHDHAGRIVAPVMVNGRGPFRFVFDTGATHSVLSLELAHELELDPHNDRHVAVTLSGVTGSERVPVVTVENLEVAGLDLGRRSVAVLDALFPGASGVLGADGLQESRVTVDFRNDTIHIEKSLRQPAPRYFHTVPFDIKFGSLLVAKGSVGDVDVKAIVDTGAEHTLGNVALRRALRVGLGKHQRPSSTDIEGVTDALQSGDMIAAPTISVGSVKISQADVTFGDLHVFKVWGYERRPALLLGMDVLGVLDVLIIDYRRKELQLLPAGGAR